MKLPVFARAFTAAVLAVSATAAPAASMPPSLDPLVALSLMGSSASQSALCAGTAAAAAASAASAQGAQPGCVLPVAGTAPPVAAGQPAPPPFTALPPLSVASASATALPLALAFAAIVSAALLLDDSEGSGTIRIVLPPQAGTPTA